VSFPLDFHLAITGGRDYHPTPSDLSYFLTLWDALSPSALHHGACRGVDTIVSRWLPTVRPSTRIIAHPAIWQRPDGSTDRSAGFRRNREMLTFCQALIAFPGGNGTRHAVRTAWELGLDVYDIRDGWPVVD